MPTVPTDPRPQFSKMDVILTNTRLGRPPLAGAKKLGEEPIGPVAQD